MPLVANILVDGLWPAVYLLLVVLVPLFCFTWIIHFFERLMQYRLATRYGWNSIILTGWLGTPIHELSHAMMCAIFQHEIVEMELFKPDRKNGRLGYVTHTYSRDNLYQQIGTFFIGVAPLLGGTIVLLILLMVFFPDTGKAALFTANEELSIWVQVGTSLKALVAGLFQPGNLLSIRLWLFLYLVICVGCHMAPSMSDYEGGMKGGLLVLAILLVGSLLVALVGPETKTLISFAKPVLVPAITIMISVIVLCGIATLFVLLLTDVTDRIRGRKPASR